MQTTRLLFRAFYALICVIGPIRAEGLAPPSEQGAAPVLERGQGQRQVESEPRGTPEEATLCGQPIPPPAQLPPDSSGPVLYYIGLCFSAQGNVSSIVPETYLHYIQLQPSRPSQGVWVPYDEAAEKTAIADFRRLWDTGFLDDLSIEATDYRFANGVTGKVITYHLEERPRVKLVTYQGTGVIDRAQIDERLRDRNLALRLDSFLDERTLAQISRVLRDMMSERATRAPRSRMPSLRQRAAPGWST